MAQATLYLGMVAGTLALLVNVVQFVRGRLDLTPFLDTWMIAVFVTLVWFVGSAGLGWGVAFYFGLWQLLLRPRVRQWELERALAQKPHRNQP